jgi:hypothetical protein
MVISLVRIWHNTSVLMSLPMAHGALIRNEMLVELTGMQQVVDTTLVKDGS